MTRFFEDSQRVYVWHVPARFAAHSLQTQNAADSYGLSRKFTKDLHSPASASLSGLPPHISLSQKPPDLCSGFFDIYKSFIFSRADGKNAAGQLPDIFFVTPLTNPKKRAILVQTDEEE